MWTDLMLRLRSLLKRDAVERELDDELRFHVDQLIAAHERQGLSRDEAVRRARLEFGALDLARDQHRDARGVGLLEELARDVRYAVRQLRRSPAFALAALSCLAIGIGATTAIVSVVNAVLLQPLPFDESDRLVRLAENVPPPVRGRPLLQRGLTFAEYLEWRQQSKTLSDAYAVSGVGQRLVRTRQGSVGLWGVTTTPNAFTLLRVPAVLGRTLEARDEANSNVVVLSYDTWRRHFNGDPAVVGTSVEFRAGALMGGTFDPLLMTVVGVLPANVALPDGWADFYWPMPPSFRGRVAMIGQLAPGVSLQSALAEANAMGAAIRPPWPADADPLTVPRFELERLKDRAVQSVRPALRVFVGAVVVVLVIVCANVANLLLARGTARRREIAARSAIGASRGRIVRQLMTESLVLALGGGALGAVVGAAGIALFARLSTVEAPGIYRLMFGSTILPRAQEVTVDVEVFAIALGVAAITSVMFGVLPALTVSRASHAGSLAARGAAQGRDASHLGAVLVVGQLALATVLLVGAGLLGHSFLELSRVNNGYNPSNALAFNLLFPSEYSVARKADTIETVLTGVRNIAGVRAAGFARHGLLIGEELFIGPWVPSGRTIAESDAWRTRVRSVSAGFLTAMGVPLLEGREFDERDHALSRPVVVVSRSAARQYFGAGSPIGQVMDWHFAKGHIQPVTVIGVVEDIRQESPTDEIFPEIFVHYRQFLHLLERAEQPPQRQDTLAVGFQSFAVRTAGDPAVIVPVVRSLIDRLDPNVGIDAIVPMSRLAASAVARERFYAVVVGVFGGVAGLLAAIGVYGVLTYTVIRRTQEIGIRMAIGAQRRAVLVLILRQGILLAAAGIAIGLAGAVVGMPLMQALLFGITPLDRLTLAAVSLLFFTVAAFASYLPARRATNVDALVALRHE